MRFTQVALAMAFVFVAASSFAHGDACKSYWTSCKSQGKKGKDAEACVQAAAAADATNGPACTAQMAKHHHGDAMPAAGAAAAPAAPAAPAGN